MVLVWYFTFIFIFSCWKLTWPHWIELLVVPIFTFGRTISLKVLIQNMPGCFVTVSTWYFWIRNNISEFHWPSGHYQMYDLYIEIYSHIHILDKNTSIWYSSTFSSFEGIRFAYISHFNVYLTIIDFVPSCWLMLNQLLM